MLQWHTDWKDKALPFKQTMNLMLFSCVTTNEKKGCYRMHVGSKGWYVEQLKRNGVRHHEGRKIEKYKTYVLANLLDKHKR